MSSCIRCAVIRKVMLMVVLIPFVLTLISTGNKASASPDTTWSATFQVNMAKAVKDSIFHPDSDCVYAVLDQGILPLKLVAGTDYKYSGTLYNELDSDKTYHLKFRINESTWENVNRTVTPLPGTVNVSAWWNDDPMNVTKFIVNMKYAAQYGYFNPSADSVCIVGTMNDWKGSPKMSRVGTSLSYFYDYSLDAGSVQEYKYRINQGDSVSHQLELLYKPNRIIRISDTLVEATSDFNNYNPAKQPMTFDCNMTYYMNAHRFDESADYLDVAGNFNNDGANDVLFDTDGDSVYSITLYLDTAYFHQAPLSFKFRINGSWTTAELQNKPSRTYAFHDTINYNPNIFGCYYNDLDPSVPTPPWVYNVAIQGDLIHKQILCGSYSYENLNGIPEDSSSYRWLRSFDATGDSVVAIDSAWKITYTVDTVDIGKWLIFEVTPRAAYGDSAVGKPVRVISGSSIGGVGIGELSSLITRVYPNPATEYFTIEAEREIDHLELYSQSGRKILTVVGLQTQAVRLNISQLPRGIYLLRAATKSHEWGVVQVVKR